MTGSFWDQQCGKRGAGLTHAHWDKCDPAAGNHPGGIERHQWDQCCSCGERSASWTPTETLSPPVPVVRAVTKDHAFRFTISGRCAECQAFEDDHPLIGIPDPQTGCDVDHRSIKSDGLLIGDAGQERVRCPRCGVQVEPKAATGFPDGPAYGRGRGYFTQRHRDALEPLVGAWLRGDR